MFGLTFNPARPETLTVERGPLLKKPAAVKLAKHMVNFNKNSSARYSERHYKPKIVSFFTQYLKGE